MKRKWKNEHPARHNLCKKITVIMHVFKTPTTFRYATLVKLQNLQEPQVCQIYNGDNADLLGPLSTKKM